MGTEVEALIRGLDYEWDPNTGTFYVNRAGWPATTRCNLHAEMWVFDCRKTYPCETAQAMRAIIDKVCEGYVQADNIGAEVPALAYGEKKDSYLHGDIWAIPPNSYPSGEGEPYDINYADFDGTEGAHSYERMRFPSSTWTTGFFSEEMVPPQMCGVIPTILLRPQFRFALLSMYPITPLRRGGAAAIKTATINVELKNGHLREYLADRYSYESGWETTSDTWTEDMSLMRLRGVVVKAEDDGRYSFVGDAGLSDGGTLAPFVVGDDTFYRGTLEIQTLLKASYALALSQPGCHIVLLWAPPTGGAEGNEEIGPFRDWVASWRATFDEVGHCTTGQLHSFALFYDAMTVSSPMVQFDKDYLSGGPNLHFDSTGHVAMPDLMYTP